MPTDAAPLEWRFTAASELGPASYGVAEVGVRRGGWSLQLLTDTLDARYEARSDAGRAWIAGRAEAGAAGMWSVRWAGGAPSPATSFSAFYGSVEGGAVRYGPSGTWAGGAFATQVWGFAGENVDQASPRPLATLDGLAGWWRPAASAWVRAGATVTDSGPSPHLAAEAKLLPGWTLAPRVEARLGVAEGADDLTKTRVGGLSPFFVPLAGAGGAELWSEDYAALRIGPALQLGADPWRGSLAMVADLAWVDAESATGLGALGHLQRGRWFVDGSLGYTPDLPRAAGVSRVGGWVAAGADWGRGAAAPVSP